jgi:hypothetical protein
VLIKNIKGTSERVPDDCSTWQEFWEKKTGLKAKGDVGGHVKRVDVDDNSWYIADITYAQNREDGPYEYDSVLAKLHD